VTFLLDVNVLIALIDPGHVAHHDAHEWFAASVVLNSYRPRRDPIDITLT
jgi:predicted nucleic acid-binding protein